MYVNIYFLLFEQSFSMEVAYILCLKTLRSSRVITFIRVELRKSRIEARAFFNATPPIHLLRFQNCYLVQRNIPLRLHSHS